MSCEVEVGHWEAGWWEGVSCEAEVVSCEVGHWEAGCWGVGYRQKGK